MPPVAVSVGGTARINDGDGNGEVCEWLPDAATVGCDGRRDDVADRESEREWGRGWAAVALDGVVLAGDTAVAGVAAEEVEV